MNTMPEAVSEELEPDPVSEPEGADVAGPDEEGGSDERVPLRKYETFFARTLATHRKKVIASCLLLCVSGIAAYMAYQEHEDSSFQADYFLDRAQHLTYAQVEVDGATELVRLKAPEGPRDVRLGYAQADEMLNAVTRHGLDVTLSASPSEALSEYVEEYGLYPPYEEKSQAGLTLLDRRETPLVEARYPARVYASYEEIPELALATIFFLENREMNGRKPATYNYVLEWDRTVKSLLMAIKAKVTDADVHGGSTLATQWEKFSHSRGGRTHGTRDKMRQIYSASSRLYGLDGEDTELGRQRIALYYINQFPLGARPDLGEVHGLRDGLYAWYGLDPDRVDGALRGEHGIKAQGHALRHTVALFIALRRPSDLLASESSDLTSMVEAALGSMHAEKLISDELHTQAMNAHLEPLRNPSQEAPAPDEVVRHKAVDSWRAALAQTLGVDSQHDLERLDIRARATLDVEAQQLIEELLIEKMRDPEFIKEEGFIREYALRDGDPAHVQYSFMLLERDEGVNKVRLEVDTLEKPFNFNRGARVDLGSTSKLRTLVTYLELVADLYDRWRPLSREELVKLEMFPRDAIASWVQRELYQDSELSKAALIDGALERTYSAHPAKFMTGGGLHVFHNFNSDYNGWRPDLKFATRKSINLVFIRLMQDLVRHYQWAEVDPAIISDPKHPRRTEYLNRWIKEDGQSYLEIYHSRYKDADSGEAMLQRLIERSRDELTPSDYVALYTYFTPNMSLQEIRAHVDTDLAESRRPILAEIDDSEWQGFYDRSKLGALNLQDRGYISEMHPLELWTIKQLMREPGVSIKTLRERMTPEVLPEIYAWLLDSRSSRNQNNKIYTILEQDAFVAIQAKWASMGYPFEDLVPSLATALGASGDRPESLARMMGMIMADGESYPISRIEEVYFGAGTPYAFRASRQPAEPEQVLHPEVARATREVMGLVVQRGTAVRARSLTEQPLFEQLIGKTGTGDHTLKHMTSSGQAVEGKAVSRAGVFMYGFGERYFGVLTVYVDGEQAEEYTFTSSMAAQIFTHIAPLLSDMIKQVEPDHVMARAPSRSVNIDDDVPTEDAPLLARVIDPLVDAVLDDDVESMESSHTTSISRDRKSPLKVDDDEEIPGLTVSNKTAF